MSLMMTLDDSGVRPAICDAVLHAHPGVRIIVLQPRIAVLQPRIAAFVTGARCPRLDGPETN